MDIARLQLRENFDALLDRQLLVGALGIERSERIRDHAAGVLDQRKHFRGR
jgi:hypothetical protein